MSNLITDEEQAFAELDKAKLLRELSPDIEQKAQEIAEKKVQEKLGGFAKAISGEPESEWGWSGKDRSGKPAPTTWDEGAETIARKAAEKAKAETLAEIEERDKRRKADEEAISETRKAKMDEIIKEWDDDWKVLVEEGELPGMSKETQDLIKAGKLSEVSVENDKGLKARWNLIQAAREEMEATGKKPNLYRFFKKQLKPAGSNAPVFAGGRGYIDQPEELSYEDIHAESQKYIR